MNPCDVFRRALEVRLRGRLDPGHLTELGWHEHLLSCGDCRALLDQEEALELLLASLPEPSLPAALTVRVLERLHATQSHSLDQLLALDQPLIPAGLAGRVRAGLVDVRAEQRAHQQLDALLDRAGQVDLPAGLASRVLSSLAAERGLSFRLLRGRGASVHWRAAAAALIVFGAAGLLWKLSASPVDSPDTPVATLSGEDERLIVWLPVLEYWDEMQQLNPLDAAIVVRVDEVDQALLEEDS